jgi:hypothetical protein
MGDLSEFWYNRILEYLQPPVGWNWYASNIEAFRQLTSGPTKWGLRLLVVDSVMESQYPDDLSQFIEANPAVLTAVVCRSGQVPTRHTLRNSVMVEYPGDIDSWLLMMRQLLKLAGIES